MIISTTRTYLRFSFIRLFHLLCIADLLFYVTTSITSTWKKSSRHEMHLSSSMTYAPTSVAKNAHRIYNQHSRTFQQWHSSTSKHFSALRTLKNQSNKVLAFFGQQNNCDSSTSRWASTKSCGTSTWVAYHLAGIGGSGSEWLSWFASSLRSICSMAGAKWLMQRR